MMEQYLLAIDAGTGSARVILFDTAGNEIGVSQTEWTHREDKRFPGSMDFDVKQNIAIITDLIKETIAINNIDPHEIVGISTTSMREGIVLYDEAGKEIWACANVDSRSVNEVSALYDMSDTMEAELYQSSGQTYSLGAIPRLLWVKNNLPEIYENMKYVTMLNDWITYKLTNVLSVEPSNGCTTGLFNIKNRLWDKEIAKKVDIKHEIFPVVHESGTVIGNITKEMAALTGLSTKTLVIAGGGDAQLGCIGAGIVNEGDAAIFGGSFWQYEYTTSNVVMDESCRVRINCHAVPNKWQYEAIAFFPGLVMRWFRDSFCDLEKHLQEKNGESIYSQMDKRARAIPAGSNGMLCTFSDVMDYKSWKHAAPSFLNFKLDSQLFNKVTFYRAIMENAALVTKGNIDLVSEITNKSPESIVFAGGASKSDLWCQIIADVLNKPINIPVVKESTALGAAICAGLGTKVYSSFDQAISQVVKYQKTIHPNESNSAVYEDLYPKWRQIYKRQLELADYNLTDYMWIAPGLKK